LDADVKHIIARSLLAAGLFLGCATTHKSEISVVYSDFRSDMEKHAGALHDDAMIRRQNERTVKVKKIIDTKGLKTAQDTFEAAVILVQTDDLDVLKLSETLGLKAAEMGEEKGFRVAAEAIDKQMVKMGVAQRYGTQYVYEPVLKGWRLYPYDPRTTDAERKAMGVQPLDELKKGEDLLNQGKTKP
jgi:hypothetical protein